jgi:hypothetical protein
MSMSNTNKRVKEIRRKIRRKFSSERRSALCFFKTQVLNKKIKLSFRMKDVGPYYLIR